MDRLRNLRKTFKRTASSRTKLDHFLVIKQNTQNSSCSQEWTVIPLQAYCLRERGSETAIGVWVSFGRDVALEDREKKIESV